MINALKKSETALSSEKLEKAHNNTQSLIDALNKKEIPDNIEDEINSQLSALQNLSGTEKEMRKAHAKVRNSIIKLVQKELGYVPKGYNRNLWMPLGMAVFGVPLGLAFSFSIDNMAFLGVGFPIGMGIGIALGIGMDQKAEKDGKQLDYESSM